MIFRKKRVVLGVGLAALGLLAVSSILNRRAIQLEWWRYQAAREPQSAAWESLLEAGEEGFPYLARLLKDDLASEEAGALFLSRSEDWKPFLEYLRARDPYGQLRFLFLRTFSHEIEWERSVWRDEAVHTDWYEYWSGNQDHLEPTSQGIDFLEDVLRKPSPSSRHRVIDALSAMLRPEEVQKPQGSLAERIVNILARIACQDPGPAIRLQAINRLMMRTAKSIDHLPTLVGWWERLGRPLGFNEAAIELRFDRDSLRALSYLDHPEALRILFGLQKIPGLEPLLNAVLSPRTSFGPIPKPEWLPLANSVKRFLNRPGLERVCAAQIAAEQNLKELLPSIREALEQESEEEARIILRGSLLALGDKEWQPLLQRALRESLKNWDDELESKYGEERNSGRYLTRPTDLAYLLLLSGDLQTLDLVFQHQDRLLVILESFVDGIPEELFWKVATSKDEEVKNARKLSAWWEENKHRVAWDPTKRKFTLRP
jgi:hypothetical protein